MDFEVADEYKGIIEQLKVMLNGDEYSVSNQLLTLSDNHLVFQLVNFCRSFENSSSKNPELANFIDQGYVSFQVTGIRGIGDDTQNRANSLPNAIYLLKKNQAHLSRANYVCHEGLSYHWEEEENRYNEELFRKVEEQGEAQSGVVPGTWSQTKRRHDQFDKLCLNNDIQNRKPDDLVDDQVFQRLLQELEKCHDIAKLYANTIVAHRQNEEGRRVLEEKQIVLTINKISECHQTLWTVFNTLNGLFLQTGLSPVISKLSQRYQFLDESWVRPEDKERYLKERNRLASEMENGLNDLVRFE